MLKKDYADFEISYQRLFASGKKVWGKPDGYDQQYVDAIRFIRPKERVLFLGCGVGVLAKRLEHLELEVVGVDISLSAIEKAKERLGHLQNYHFFVESVLDLPDLLGVFDVIWDDACTHCILRDDRPALWNSLKNRLAPNGRLVVRCMAGESPKVALEQEPDLSFDAALRTVFRSGVPIRYFPTMTDLEQELVTNQFELLHSEFRTDEDGSTSALIETKHKPI